MNLAPTDLNQRLSEAVRNRVAADRLAVAEQAGFIRLVGVGFIAFGIGAALGIGFYGYSLISRNSENMKTLSLAFSKALSEAELRGTAVGTVQVKPNELSLAKGQSVSLDNQARVLLDPKAAAKVISDIGLAALAPGGLAALAPGMM
jgi:hypothetical protein